MAYNSIQQLLYYYYSLVVNIITGTECIQQLLTTWLNMESWEFCKQNSRAYKTAEQFSWTRILVNYHFSLNAPIQRQIISKAYSIHSLVSSKCSVFWTGSKDLQQIENCAKTSAHWHGKNVQSNLSANC